MGARLNLERPSRTLDLTDAPRVDLLNTMDQHEGKRRELGRAASAARVWSTGALAVSLTTLRAKFVRALVQGFGPLTDERPLKVYALRTLATGALFVGTALLALAATFASLSLPGCKPPSSLASAEARVAYQADSIARAVAALENAAIEANAALDPKTDRPLLATVEARRVVSFCVTTERTLKQTPEGWYATVRAAYDAMKATLSPQERTTLALYLTAIETVLGAYEQTHESNGETLGVAKDKAKTKVAP